MSIPVSKIHFSAEQLMYLESIYPEVSSSGQSYAELQYRAGQRSVLEFMKRNARLETRYVQKEVLRNA